jgi:hypothetical protein
LRIKAKAVWDQFDHSGVWKKVEISIADLPPKVVEYINGVRRKYGDVELELEIKKVVILEEVVTRTTYAELEL